MLGKSKKLGLNKETVRALSGNEMQGLVGGLLFAQVMHCSENCCSKTCGTCGCPAFNFNRVIYPI